MPHLGFWKKLVNRRDDPSADKPESPAEEGSKGEQPANAKQRSSQKGEGKSNGRHFAAEPAFDSGANRLQNASKPATNPPPATLDRPRTKVKLKDKTSATRPDSIHGTGFFSNYRDFVINQPMIIDKSQAMHNVMQGGTALEVLSREMTEGVDVDSSARWPPPSCYPGTRVSLITKIQDWLFDDHRKWDILWLNGPAGVGKSAVAQTIAEFALERGVLGAAYFFSRPNERHNYLKVFITLAYQLAVRFPGYQPLVARMLAADPDLLEKAPNVQFKRLIVEPLSSLSHERRRLIVLDGLDECSGERAQREIIELINNVTLTGTPLPIIWMICSRPEPHLKLAFSRADYAIQCWREELLIDTAESRYDAAKFIRGRFREIHDKYRDCVEEDTNGSWPSEDAIMQIIHGASSLSVLASTIFMYIEDGRYADPDGRLSEVLSVLQRLPTFGGHNPLSTLDTLYSHILSGIPTDILPTAHQILALSTFRVARPLTAQAIWSVLDITRADFYAAVRNLHPLVNVPEPDYAAVMPLRFFHASFFDYLLNESRSGHFYIGDVSQTSLYTVMAHSMSGTRIDAPSRYPLPRCHPGTRKSTIEEIENWMVDMGREHDMLWLYGPAGIGKTAIAQTIAEYADTSSILGAAVFLSRTRDQNDPSRFWTSISLDLTRHNDLYKLLIQKHIRDHDEAVLTAGLQTQFNRLISQLLSAVVVEQKLLILIDGLDECQGEKEQCEIIECICEVLRRPIRLPVIWMICSRPESHLKRAFRKAESEDLCWVKELLIDDPEAQGDVERYLQDELWRIAKRHGGDLCEKGNWPSKDAFNKIVSASSGLFVFVTTIARFIGEPGSDPQEQLAAVIASIDGSLTPSTTNPLAFVDKLYLDILGRSPSDLLPTTLQLLGICAVCPSLPVLHLAQLLGFDLGVLQVAVMSLHSVIDVPSGEDMIENPLRYYHASFPDFLANHDRSGTFSQDLDLHRLRTAEACLRVLGHTKTSYADNLAWDPKEFEQANPSNLSVSNVILMFAATHAWDLCMKIGEPKLELIRDTVADFDYRSLRYVTDTIPVQSFVRFLRWLYSLTKGLHDPRSLVRTSPSSALDVRFIEKCAGIAEPLTLEPTLEEDELQESPRYTLIGFDKKTVVILAVPDGVMAYTAEDVDDL